MRWRESIWRLFLLIQVFPWTSNACQTLQIDVENVKSKIMTLYRPGSHEGGGRSSFVSKEKLKSSLYLYHIVVEVDGYTTGRWVINDQFGSTTQAIAYIDSWAVMPHLISSITPQLQWKIFKNEWVFTSHFSLKCISETDETIYLDLPSAWQLSGYYVQIEKYIYSQIRLHYPKQMYLYKFVDQWIIGEETNTNKGLAYVVDSAERATEIKSSNKWFILQSGKWVPDSVVNIIISPPSSSNQSLYEAVREYRSLSLPPVPLTSNSRIRPSSWRLWNGLPIPVIGLGTGGISSHYLPAALNDSYSLGYRLYDLAREYRNEHIVGRLLRDPDVIPSLKDKRQELFLISKVWPTQLGYSPTLLEIIASENQLSTSYIDMYFLHWPECYKTVSWMHCETTVDKAATWRHSYRALERLYQEGHLLSIGVSNFNRNLLNELTSFAKVLPHAVQNHGEINQYDLEVRRWCKEHHVLYMPYATGRNIKSLPTPTLEVLNRLAKTYNVSKNAIVSQLFIQTGAVIIPRTTNIKHLEENIRLLSWELTPKDREDLGWNAKGISEQDQITYSYRSVRRSEYEVNPEY